MGGGKGEQAFKTLGLKEELCVTRIPGASSAASIPGQELEKPQSEMSTGTGKTGRGHEKAIVSWQNDQEWETRKAK